MNQQAPSARCGLCTVSPHAWRHSLLVYTGAAVDSQVNTAAAAGVTAAELTQKGGGASSTHKVCAGGSWLSPLDWHSKGSGAQSEDCSHRLVAIPGAANVTKCPKPGFCTMLTSMGTCM